MRSCIFITVFDCSCLARHGDPCECGDSCRLGMGMVTLIQDSPSTLVHRGTVLGAHGSSYIQVTTSCQLFPKPTALVEPFVTQALQWQRTTNLNRVIPSMSLEDGFGPFRYCFIKVMCYIFAIYSCVLLYIAIHY